MTPTVADFPPTRGEVRAWAMRTDPSIATKGRLPDYVVTGWNRAHPDRPYVERSLARAARP